MNLRWPLAAVAAVCFAFGAMAQTATAPLAPLVPSKAWAQLTPQQKQVLAPLVSQWNELGTAERDQWLALAARYPTMQGEEQARFRTRLQEWAQMTPAQRLQARQGFLGAQKVTAAEREAKWAAYQQLPVEKRQALQERAAQRASGAAMAPAAAASAPRPGVSSLQPGQRALAAAPWAPARGLPPSAPASAAQP